jgi:hypothetical protein
MQVKRITGVDQQNSSGLIWRLTGRNVKHWWQCWHSAQKIHTAQYYNKTCFRSSPLRLE